MIGISEFQAGALDKRYYGVAVAIVTDNVDPDKQGRVKLRFPWYDDRLESDWCRVVYLNAGPNHGFIAVPEVESEVLVAFEHGDMRRPYVLGALYNGVDAPPTDRQQDSQKNEKLLQTPAGHRLLFRDTQGDTLVELQTKGGHKLTLRDQGSSGTAALIARTQGGHQLEMEDGGNKITLTTPAGCKLDLDETGKKATLTTGAGQSVELGPATITVKATKVALEAAQVELGQGAAESVILGTSFLGFFNRHVHTATSQGAPTTPPVEPMNPSLLSTATRTK